MVIGACGYGCTGSSIITDLLREFNEIQVFDDFEFSFTYRVDGLEDLEYHLMKQYAKNISGDAAIKRFLYAAKYINTPLIHKPTSSKNFYKITQEYIDSILQARFRGMESIDIISGNVLKNVFTLGMKKIILPKTIENITKKPSYVWPNREIYVCVEPENFYEASKKYICDILKAMGADLSKPIALDQPFGGNKPQNSFKFFDNPKAVIVDRDPRDLYLETKYRLISEGRFIPHEDIEMFVEYYQRIRTGRPMNNTEQVLLLRFEDLIYNYEECLRQLIQFLKLKEHVSPKKYFNPARSINNTQLSRKYPHEKEAIQYIEKTLSDYLYPFEQYKDVDTSGAIFVGSAKYQENKRKLKDKKVFL